MESECSNYSKYLDPNAHLKIPRSTIFGRKRRNLTSVEPIDTSIAIDETDVVYDDNVDDLMNEIIDNPMNELIDDSMCDTVDDDEYSMHSQDEQSDSDCEIDGDCYSSIYEVVINAVVKMKVMDLLSLIFVFSVRHNLSWTTMESLAKLISCILGDESVPSSKYHFKKLFSPSKNMNVHFICKKCRTYLGTNRDCSIARICPVCNENIDMKTKNSDSNFFVTLPIEQQLKLHAEKCIRDGDLKFQNNRIRGNGPIQDIYDGDAYQNLIGINGGHKFLTLTVNTDGASIHKSTKNASVWPLQFFVNEICELKRYAISNVLVAALAYGATPDMSCFLRTFIEEINDINARGGICIAINGIIEKVKIFPIVWSVDSVAKCSLLKKIQFNGYRGCPYCHHPGSLVQGNNIRFCKEHHASDRTNENTRNAMKRAYCDKIIVKGYYGISPLSALTNFDIVWQVCIDKMHNVDLGVLKKWFCLLLDSRNHDKEYVKLFFYSLFNNSTDKADSIDRISKL